MEGFDDDEFDGGDSKEHNSEGDFANLINFANLENMMRHIIRKFKSLESHGSNLDEDLVAIKSELESRATLQTVDDVANELRGKIEHYHSVFQSQKEAIVNLETQLERTRVMALSLEKKLEVCVKEKAVQDRFLRETQDALQDKVAIAELNMFEAKFAGYTTKVEHQEVLTLLSQYTRTEVSERISESLRVVSTKFEDFTRTARIEQLFQEYRDWVTDELGEYAKSAATNAKFEEIGNQIKDTTHGFERSATSIEDKLRAMSDRITSVYAEFHKSIKDCALEVDLRALQSELSKYALRKDVEVFQMDCGPKLKFCVDSIRAFDTRLSEQDDAIRRVDEVLLDKAGKYDIVVANARIEQCFLKEKAMAEFKSMYERLDWMGNQLEEYIASEAERLNAFKPPNYTPVFEDIRKRIELKADRADLIEIYQVKANRIDAEELTCLQDTIHRQLEYLSVTTFGLAKLALTDSKAGDSKTVRAQQKSQVLMQSELLWHWVLHNEMPGNLDSLRTPVGAASQMQNQGAAKQHRAAPSAQNEQMDQEKRYADQQKRAQLERKLGLDPSA